MLKMHENNDIVMRNWLFSFTQPEFLTIAFSNKHPKFSPNTKQSEEQGLVYTISISLIPKWNQTRHSSFSTTLHSQGTSSNSLSKFKILHHTENIFPPTYPDTQTPPTVNMPGSFTSPGGEFTIAEHGLYTRWGKGAEMIILSFFGQRKASASGEIGVDVVFKWDCECGAATHECLDIVLPLSKASLFTKRFTSLENSMVRDYRVHEIAGASDDGREFAVFFNVDCGDCRGCRKSYLMSINFRLVSKK